MPITMEDVRKFLYVYAAHYNLGFERDEDGKYLPNARPMGYRYRHDCVTNPRVYFMDSHYKVKDGKTCNIRERKWYVDNEELPYEMIADRLNFPPLLTLAEFYVLWRIPPGIALEGGNYVQTIVGRPAKGETDPTYVAVYRACENLRHKGMVFWKDGKLTRVEIK